MGDAELQNARDSPAPHDSTPSFEQCQYKDEPPGGKLPNQFFKPIQHWQYDAEQGEAGILCECFCDPPKHDKRVLLLPLACPRDASDDSSDDGSGDDEDPHDSYNTLFRGTACPACDSSDAMFNFDIFLALLNRALLLTVHGKTYRNDRGEDMGPALSMFAYSKGFKSMQDSFVATGDCEDWMAKFVQLCRTHGAALRDRLAAMDPNITCEIQGIRVEFIPPMGESMCHTTTGVLYCNAHTGMCEIHVVENTDKILIADNPCTKIAELFHLVLSTADAHRKYRCVQWFGDMLVFEMTCGELYCGARCYMPYVGTPIRLCTQRDLQRLKESPYPCNERRLVFMDVALYFGMHQHIPFAESVPPIPEAKRCFLVDYIVLLRKYQPILCMYFDENVEKTRVAADAWVALQRQAVREDNVQCRLSSANFRHGVFEQIKPLP